MMRSNLRTPVEHRRVTAEHAGRRVDNYLLAHFKSVPRSRIYRLLRKGEVRVNKKRVDADYRLVEGDDLRLPPLRLDEEVERGAPPIWIRTALERAIVFEDARILVIDKPAGIAVHGGSGLSFGVIEVLRAARPGEPIELVHRLDRDTSGLLIIARKRAALRQLHALIREGKVRKCYTSLLAGRLTGERRVDVPLIVDERVRGERHVRPGGEGKASLTLFRALENFGAQATLVEAEIPTGRMHQIRVHAAHMGHAVLGDAKYGDAARNADVAALGLKRAFLHASTLSFEWPDTGERFEITAPLPAELDGFLAGLRAT